jgi:hypothetical protein
MGYDFSKTRELLSGSKAAMIVYNEPVALRLKYKGTGTVTSVTVTTGTNIVLVTSDGGTDTYAFATFTTMGNLEDAINSDGIFEAKVLDALRQDLTSGSPLVDGAKTITTDGYYDLCVDTNVTFSLTYRCAYDRNVKKEAPVYNHRVKLNEFIYYATLGNASANDVQVWEYDREHNTETQVYQATSVSATVTTTRFANGKGNICSGNGNDLIVRLIDNTSLADSGAFLQVNYTRE